MKDRFRTATSKYTMCTDDVHSKRMLPITSFLMTQSHSVVMSLHNVLIQPTGSGKGAKYQYDVTDSEHQLSKL